MKKVLLLAYITIASLKIFAQQGCIDSTFGINGIVTTSINANTDYSYKIAIQPDNKIIAVGKSNNGTNNDFALARYSADGILDITFGNNGIVTTSIGSSDDYINAVAIQNDGKIIVAGCTNNGSKRNFVVARYNTNGTLDNSFGNNGIVISTITNYDDYANSINIQDDGKIVVAGYSNDASSVYSSADIIRLNENGLLDNAFGIGGIVKREDSTLLDYNVSCSVIKSNGEILLGGSIRNSAGANFMILGFNSEGTINNGFGYGGGLTELGGFGSTNDWINDMALQPDGKIVCAGSSSPGPTCALALVRLNSNGTSDFTKTISWTNFGASAVTIQNNGKIITAGFIMSGSPHLSLFRFDTNGNLDNTFGVCANNSEPGTDVAIQSNGKIITCSYTGEFSLARFFGDITSANQEYLLDISFSIFPNPFSQSTQITLNQSYRSIALAVYDIQGKQVAQQQYTDSDKIQFSRNQLSNGLYFLKLTLDEKEVETGKIMISEE